jgi:putative component of toxin-antitoxin plasmid stabilization module
MHIIRVISSRQEEIKPPERRYAGGLDIVVLLAAGDKSTQAKDIKAALELVREL